MIWHPHLASAGIVDMWHTYIQGGKPLKHIKINIKNPMAIKCFSSAVLQHKWNRRHNTQHTLCCADLEPGLPEAFFPSLLFPQDFFFCFESGLVIWLFFLRVIPVCFFFCYVSLSVYMHVCLHVDMCVCISPSLTLEVFLDCSPYYSLRLSLSVKLRGLWSRLVELASLLWNTSYEDWNYRWVDSGNSESGPLTCTVNA